LPLQRVIRCKGVLILIKKIALGVVAAASVMLLAGCASNAAAPTPSASKTSDIDVTARVALPADIRSSGVLRIATDATYAPNEFMDSHNTPIGWEVELVKAMAKRLGLKPVVTQVTFDDIFNQINSNQQDMGVSSFFDTKARQASVDMVDYYRAGTQWGQRKGSNVDPNNACGLTVAVQKDSYQFDTDLPARNAACKKDGRAAIRIKPYNTQDAANEAVEFGQASAFIADSPVTQFSVLQSSGTFVTAGEVYDTYLYGMPVKKGSQLSKAITLALQGLIEHDTYRQILASWGVQEGALGEITLNQGK